MNNLIASDRKREQILVSGMTGKLSGIAAINTDTTSNEFCKRQHFEATNTICNSCYSWDMLQTSRKNCVAPWANNSRLLSERELTDGELLQTRGASLLTDIVRFNGHGELINDTHLINLMRLAELLPRTFFVLWTKRKDIIRRFLRGCSKPANVRFILSNPIVDKVATRVPAGFDKVFNVVTEKSKRVNCFAACRECMLCYDANNTTKQIIEVIK